MAERKRFLLDEIQGQRDPTGQLIPIYSDTGFSSRPRDHFMTMYGRSDPTQWITYFNDFTTLEEFNGITATGSWLSNSTGTTPTFALADVNGGVGLITLSSADNDRQFFQTVAESFLMAAGKQAFFKVRFACSDATESDLVFGLQITDTTPLAVSDGIYWQKDDGDAYLDFHTTLNGTSSDATAVATLVADTYTTLGFYYDGGSRIYYAVNEVTKGFLPTTYLCTDEELAISFGIQNGEGVAKTLSVDYLFAALQR